MTDWSNYGSDSIQFLCLDFESLDDEVHLDKKVFYKRYSALQNVTTLKTNRRPELFVFFTP